MIRNFLTPDKFTGYHMLTMICLFFGVIIAVNMTLAFFAANSWTGLVVKNTYVESQIFNEKQAERQRQLDLGWMTETNYNDGVFRLSLNDADGSPLAVDNITAKFGRVIHEGDDVVVSLISNGDGVYSSEVELDSGLWNLDLEVYRNDGTMIWSKPIRFTVGG